MDSPTGEAMDVGVIFLRILSPFYFVVSAKIIADSVLRGAGRMKGFVIATFTDLILAPPGAEKSPARHTPQAIVTKSPPEHRPGGFLRYYPEPKISSFHVGDLAHLPVVKVRGMAEDQRQHGCDAPADGPRQPDARGAERRPGQHFRQRHAHNIVIQSVINGFGTATIAGYSASVKLNNLRNRRRTNIIASTQLTP